MEYIAVTVDGIEDTAIQEIKELINSNAEKAARGRVRFKTTRVKELFYITRSINRIYELKKSFKFITLNDIVKSCPNFKIENPFKVICVKDSDNSFTSKDVEMLIGEMFSNKGYKVNLDEPKTVIYIEVIDNLCFIGIDITKKDLQKRDYRIKIHNQSPNALVAYSMIRVAEWKKEESLLDPFAKDGVIPIEAALFASNIPRGYFSDEKIERIDKEIKKDKLNITAYDSLLHNVRSCEVNAKLADINKLIKFSKVDVDWLDVKFNKETVDKIITTPPFVARDKPSKDIEKLYHQLFHKAAFILKKKGTLVILAHRLDLIKKYSKDFSLTKELPTKIGDMELTIQVYKKK